MLITPSRACLTLAFLNFLHCSWASQRSEFPDEVVFGIFKNFSVEELNQAALVCKQWKKISLTEELWEELARRHEEEGGCFKKISGFYMDTKSIPTWKEILKKNFFLPEEKKSGFYPVIWQRSTFSSIQRKRRPSFSIKTYRGPMGSLSSPTLLSLPKKVDPDKAQRGRKNSLENPAKSSLN